MIEIRCTNCNNTVVSHSVQMKCCGCDNMACVNGDVVSANDMSLVVITSSVKPKTEKEKPVLLAKPKRKIRKQNFEVR